MLCRQMASKNKVLKSYIGMGYYNTHVPPGKPLQLMLNPVLCFKSSISKKVWLLTWIWMAAAQSLHASAEQLPNL